MVKPQISWFYTLCTVLALLCEIAQARTRGEAMTKSGIYHSPEFVMQPGSVVNRFFFNIDFPRNHIGIKSFFAEVVDDAGESVSLHDTYLHHWVVIRYYQRVGTSDERFDLSNYKDGSNAGVCQRIRHHFGQGSETRKTETHIPDPYAIEVGNPTELPAGFEERWMLNIHAIDTRNVVDKLGCSECKCSLYNVTVDEYGQPLSPDYNGGSHCCYDNTQCKVKEGFEHSPRRLYLRYTVKWFDWDESLIPVRVYLLDITDTSRISNGRHDCEIEYEVEPCKQSAVSNDRCIDNKKLTFRMPRGGYVIYVAGHQHPGGIGTGVYRKDGEVICISKPYYGNGNEAGNEAGYIVGMSSCYPKPGSVMIEDGETLVIESNYSSSQRHTGVMGLYYVLIAEQLPQKLSFLDAVIAKVDDTHIPNSAWTMLVLGIVAVAIFAVGFRRRDHVEDGYKLVSK